MKHPRVLIIDNHSKHTQEILARTPNATVLKREEFTYEQAESYDAVILSGGSQLPVAYNQEAYKEQFKLIKNTNKPLLGICMGFEILCSAYNEELTLQEAKTSKHATINLTHEDELLTNLPRSFKAYEAHRWKVQHTKHLRTLATSSKGVEIARHPTKPQWGVQFHPEADKEKSPSAQVLRNFLELLNDF